MLEKTDTQTDIRTDRRILPPGTSFAAMQQAFHRTYIESESEREN